jgi:hypothetical protein
MRFRLCCHCTRNHNGLPTYVFRADTSLRATPGDDKTTSILRINKVKARFPQPSQSNTKFPDTVTAVIDALIPKTRVTEIV